MRRGHVAQCLSATCPGLLARIYLNGVVVLCGKGGGPGLSPDPGFIMFTYDHWAGVLSVKLLRPFKHYVTITKVMCGF
jgi:hypothetical protein